MQKKEDCKEKGQEKINLDCSCYETDCRRHGKCREYHKKNGEKPECMG